jgi:4-hydroxybenzoate polyprenyltransferase
MLLMWPTLWSLVLASRGLPPWRLIVIFAAGSFLMRSAGVVLNDLADRSFDRRVSRTQKRPLASGELAASHAAGVVAVLLAVAALLVLQLNSLALALSPVAVLLAGLYPFAKRVILIPQAVLGIAFGWGAVMAWAAVRGTIELPAWMIFLATVFWAIGYDTVYALQDMEDDRRIGIKSSALFFGPSTWLAVGGSLTGMLLLLGIAGGLAEIRLPFYGVLATVGLLCAKQILEIRQPVPPSRAFRLFHQHVWFGAAILLGLVTGFWW